MEKQLGLSEPECGKMVLEMIVLIFLTIACLLSAWMVLVGVEMTAISDEVTVDMLRVTFAVVGFAAYFVMVAIWAKWIGCLKPHHAKNSDLEEPLVRPRSEHVHEV
ncbi:UNVERIFIED_CONTAM: hypothetical protein Sindi_0761100 [Sesamum indicum]